MNRLQSTAKDKGTAGWDMWYGWGIVDAAAALGGETPPPPPPPVTLLSIEVTPASATIAIGGTQEYTAMGTYSDGEPPVDITSSVTWRSSKTRIASIDSSGLAQHRLALPVDRESFPGNELPVVRNPLLNRGAFSSSR